MVIAKKFDELTGIENIMAILGLKFPDSATEFQRAFLTLAHMMASCRDYVLKGHDIPVDLIELILDLALMVHGEREKQR